MENMMQEIISPNDIDDLIKQLRNRTNLSLAEVAYRIMWSLARLAQVQTSLSADELRELGEDIEAPGALFLPTLFERDWRLTGSSSTHHEDSFRFERGCGFRLSARIRLSTDNCGAE